MGSPANLYEFIVVVHVLSAVIWVGGLLFIPLVVVPASRTLPEPQRPRQLAEVGRRFRHVGWSAVTLSLATGAYMLAHWGATWSSLVDLSFFRAPHTRLLGYKLLLVAAMLVSAGLHDWWLGPESAERAGEDSEFVRTASRWLARLTAVLAVSVILLAIFVARPRF